MIRTVIAAIGLYLALFGVAEVLVMGIHLFIPGVFEGSIQARILSPIFLTKFSWGALRLVVGLLVLRWRDWFSRLLEPDREVAFDSLALHRKYGPVLFQLLALYLLIMSLGEIVYLAWGVASAGSGAELKINLATMIADDRVAPLVIAILSLILLFKAHWLFGKLNPDPEPKNPNQLPQTTPDNAPR